MADESNREYRSPLRVSKGRTEGLVNLRSVAEHLQLSPGTVSAVLNNAPSSRHIPETTRRRIFAAASELNYHPNFFARSLRAKRTYTIGVIAEDIGDAYCSLVLAGIEDYLRTKDYFFFIAGIRNHDDAMFRQYSQLLLQRGAEGLIAIGLNLREAISVPAIAVSGHQHQPGTTNIVLDHKRAAQLALEHLVSLGHRQIAFIKGHPANADTEVRWQAILTAAEQLRIKVPHELTVQINVEGSSPQQGYPFTKTLLNRKHPFTALFAFNDLSAIGAIRALQEAGWRVPQDISVVGFDDIQGAAFHSPSLTTVRQPLRQMGEMAAQALVSRIEGQKEFRHEIAVEPELVVRESTAKATGN